MARRILNRKDLRADYEAAERRKQDDEEVEGDEEETDEAEDEAEGEAEEGEEEAEEGEEEDEAPAAKKKPARKAAPKEPKPKRSRAAKQVRMRLVWGVYNNSNQCVAKFDYPKRKEAEEHAARLQAAKNPPQPFFIQPLKEPMEDKKD
jgi:hypothetical protein